MSSTNAQNSEKNSLTWLLALAAVAVAGGGALTVWFLNGVTVAGIQTGLTNVATVGGVASGLSLSGTAVLSLKGQVLDGLVRDYGTFLRGVIFGGYSLMVASALVCALFSAKPDHPAAMWVMAYTAVVTLVGLVLTAFMINGLLAKNNQTNLTGVTPSPVVTRTR